MNRSSPVTQGANPYTGTLTPLWMAATDVSIDNHRIQELAREWSEAPFPIPDWRQMVFPEDDSVFVDFIGIGNTINFAFTNFETYESYQVEYRGQIWRGAYAMWAALKRALDNGLPVFDASYLTRLDQTQFQIIFDGITDLPLARERIAMLRITGAVLADRFRGTFKTLFVAPHPSAFGRDGVVTQLVDHFESFRDIGNFEPSGTVAQFHKRAQLFAMMYEGRARTSKLLQSLSDADLIGPIADYSVPRALLASGVLKYSERLHDAIRSHVQIQPSTREELEIRAVAIRAQQLLLLEINRLRSAEHINYIQLDYKLWTLGRTVKEPHHLTPTTAY